MKLKLKPPGIERLKLKHDEPLSTFAFNCNLRRYTVVRLAAVHRTVLPPGRGLHSSTFRLNLSRF